MLQELTYVEVVGRAHTGEAALELVARLDPDLVLIDLVMQGMGGEEAARYITEEEPCPKVILMSLFFTCAAKKRLQSIGAHGFVDKQDFVDQIKPLLGGLFSTPETP